MKKITLLTFMLCVSAIAFAQFPAPYCGPIDFTSTVEPLTLVEVADISNVSDPATGGTDHEDFIAIVGNMSPDESYTIALEGNTDGNFENRFAVFIDWNQNDILDDAGEVYEILETITGSTGTDGMQATGDIAVPADAMPGNTRMRVKKIFGTTNYLDPCLGTGFGQVEDYTITVAPPLPFPGAYCGPIEFTSTVEPMTLVNVADINNVSDAATGGDAHEDFTAIVGNMDIGASYPIALEGNTDGNFENRFAVFIDWNQNDILDDAGEVYEILETITGSTGTDGMQATGDILVPAGALEGSTRMRVKKIFGTTNYLDPCLGTGFGQVEDYTIMVSAGAITCFPPANFVVTASAETTVDFSWDAEPTATNGYLLEVFEGGVSVDMQTIAAGTLVASVTGLNPATTYDATLISDCDADGTSDPVMLSFTTDAAPPACGGKFYDTGGPDNDFPNNEAYQVTISPDNAGDVVTASFVFVDTGGGGFDILQVDIGDGAGFVQVPEVAAGGTPAVFTSVAADGSLLFDFFSSGVVPNPGWDADITCAPAVIVCDAPENIVVSNVTDSTADISWDEATSAVDGYGVAVVLQGDDPEVDPLVYASPIIPQGTFTDTATGLSEGVAYDAYVVSLCDLGSTTVTFSAPIPFDTTLGLADSAIVDYTIFPNPASNEINLKAAFSIENIVVSNTLGQQVMVNKGGSAELTLDIANLQVGTYFMKATVNGIDVVERFIKK